MYKKVLTLCLLLFSINSFAQKRQNIYYFKNGMLTSNKETADYRRVVQEPDSGSSLFPVFEFYSDNTDKTIGLVSKYEPNLVFEGLVKRFNKKGILTEELNYKNGKLSGKAIYYYDNGKVKRELDYNENVKVTGVSDHVFSRLINEYDSLGNQNIKDGNGSYICSGKELTEQGNYKNGYKDGVWKGLVNGNAFEENYQDGRLIAGTAHTKEGKTIEYTVAEEYPNYPGGIGDFYKYLGRNYRFPSEAQKNGVRGRLYISFAVEKDGKLTDYSFKNDLGYGTREEAIRVLDRSPKWNPGKQHGIPVRVKYNININLAY